MRPNLILLLTTIGLILAACGGGGTGQPPTNNEAGGLSGQVVVSGSSTVEPITARVAETFAAQNPNVAVSVDGPGTSDGFELFCNGETDISDASRAISAEEIETCTQNGVEPIEISVAIDGLSVLTSTDNAEVSCLDFGDLYALLGPESTGFQTWSDADGLAAELQAGGLGGSHAPYIEAPLVVTAPGEESGTFDSFIEIVLADIAEQRGAEETTRPDYVASGNDNVIIEGISGSPTSLGWVGYAFFLANQQVVKALEIDGGGGCVAPTPETIASGDYPISRPLYIYVNKARAEEKPEVTALVDFYLTEEGLASVDDTGYVRLTEEEYAQWRESWTGRRVVTGP
ncbi:MAG: phosphate ABC transporter substrate-binding protein PstS family protein [Acidimicrobiia bacterium]